MEHFYNIIKRPIGKMNHLSKVRDSENDESLSISHMGYSMLNCAV